MEMTSNLAYSAYQAYVAYLDFATAVRSRSAKGYMRMRENFECYTSVIQIRGISEHPHLPINGYFDIPPNFVKTQDQPSLHHFLIPVRLRVFHDPTSFRQQCCRRQR